MMGKRWSLRTPLGSPQNQSLPYSHPLSRFASLVTSPSLAQRPRYSSALSLFLPWLQVPVLTGSLPEPGVGQPWQEPRDETSQLTQMLLQLLLRLLLLFCFHLLLRSE